MDERTQGPQAFRPVPRTGVIYVMTEAAAAGYRAGDPAWANLGQGQPETGPLPGAPPRIERLEIEPADQEYAPVAGAVARGLGLGHDVDHAGPRHGAEGLRRLSALVVGVHGREA